MENIMQVKERTNGKIHLGTIGMGIPRIYSEVVAKIMSSHLAVESVLIKYIKIKSLKPLKKQFISRLDEVQKALGERGCDWSIEASRMLNSVRNKCAHIDDENYQSIELRLESYLDTFIQFVEVHNERLKAHKICDFELACIMTYQRLYDLLELNYAPLEMGKFSSLPAELQRYFVVRECSQAPD